MNLAPSSVLDPPSHHTLHADHDLALHSTHDSNHASHLEIIAAAPIATAAWHAFLWLVIGNAIGVMLSVLLLVPSLNAILGEWTYGRWMMVHVNILLYGWCSLPMLGWLFRIYGADRGPLAPWCRPVLWTWSTALFIGSLTWLAGHSSGKLFLDWSGFARFAFPAAMFALWLLLACSTVLAWNSARNKPWSAHATKIIGLAILLAVPTAIYVASSPGLYPAINPSTGGPTGESQLESSLGVVAILLIVPFGVARRKPNRPWPLAVSAIVFAAEALFCLSMNRGDISHHLPSQYLSLGSLLIWLPLATTYYATFQWHDNTRSWRGSPLVVGIPRRLRLDHVPPRRARSFQVHRRPRRPFARSRRGLPHSFTCSSSGTTARRGRLDPHPTLVLPHVELECARLRRPHAHRRVYRRQRPCIHHCSHPRPQHLVHSSPRHRHPHAHLVRRVARRCISPPAHPRPCSI